MLKVSSSGFDPKPTSAGLKSCTAAASCRTKVRNVIAGQVQFSLRVTIVLLIGFILG
jgi:hypothetical protein